MSFQIIPLPTDVVQALRQGGPDANGQPAEHAVSDGVGTPCRHCLRDVPAGAGMLILAHRPFDTLQPYAECGPIFLCAGECDAWQGAADTVPPILETSDSYLVKGYFATQRIAYGTGATLPVGDIPAAIARILEREDVAFVDIRSARNNCFQARAVRA